MLQVSGRVCTPSTCWSATHRIEGNDKCQGELAATGVPFEISLVGRAEGSITYHRRKDGTCAASTGNSVFKENT